MGGSSPQPPTLSIIAVCEKVHWTLVANKKRRASVQQGRNGIAAVGLRIHRGSLDNDASVPNVTYG